jgi:hypothetical protein
LRGDDKTFEGGVGFGIGIVDDLVLRAGGKLTNYR